MPKCSQCPGIALYLAISAILKPPSRTTFASAPYNNFVLSYFSPRALQQYRKALTIAENMNVRLKGATY